MLEVLIAASLSAEPLEETIVTGNRLGQPRDEVAASVTTLTDEQLKLTPTTTVDQLLNQAAGVMVQSTNGQQHLTAIRSPVLTGGAGQGSFLYLEDGLPLRAAALGNVNGLLEANWEMADGIELWRGPATAVYGANAVHGLVNVLHQRPDDTSLQLTGSKDGRQLLIESPLSQGYLKAYINRDDGWRDSTGLDQEKIYLSMPFSLAGVRFDNTLAVHRLDQQTAGFIRGETAYKDTGLIRTNPNPEAYRKVDGVRWKSDIKLLADALLISPYYREIDSELLMHFLPSQAIEEASQSSIGVMSSYNLSISGVAIQLGADIDLSEGDLYEEQLIPDVYSYTQGVHYDYTVQTQNIAGFAQLSGDLSAAISWEAGLRYESMHYDYTNHLNSGAQGRFLRPESGDEHFDVWLPKLAMRYKLTEHLSLWSRLSRGGRTPQASDLYRLQVNQTGGLANVETLDNAELGWLYERSDLTVEAIVYYQYKRGVFFRDANGYSEANGQTDHRGIELDLQYQFNEQWLWQASLSHSDHRYRFDREITSGANQTETILNGSQVDTAPNWLGSQRLTWTPNARWNASLRWDWVGSYYMDASNQHQYDGHQLFNLALNYRPIEALSLGVDVHNLSNERYADRADYAFGSERYLPGRPRTVNMTATWTF